MRGSRRTTNGMNRSSAVSNYLIVSLLRTIQAQMTISIQFRLTLKSLYCSFKIMQHGSHRSTKASIFRFILIGTLAYFSTVYPYVHFHNSHDDDFEVTFSLHPLGVDPDNLPDHDGKNHHHNLQRPTSGCVLTRQTAPSISLPQAFLLTLAQFSPVDNSNQTSKFEIEDPPRLWSVYENLPAPLRGPPALT